MLSFRFYLENPGYADFEERVKIIIQDVLEVPNGDAQAIMETDRALKIMTEEWFNGNVIRASDRIINGE